jgi:hypothetical protein
MDCRQTIGLNAIGIHALQSVGKTTTAFVVVFFVQLFLKLGDYQ